MTSDPITLKMEELVAEIMSVVVHLDDVTRLERELFELVSAEDSTNLETLLDGQTITIDGEYTSVKGENPDAEFLHDMDVRRRENIGRVWTSVALHLGTRLALLNYGIEMRKLME